MRTASCVSELRWGRVHRAEAVQPDAEDVPRPDRGRRRRRVSASRDGPGHVRRTSRRSRPCLARSSRSASRRSGSRSATRSRRGTSSSARASSSRWRWSSSSSPAATRSGSSTGSSSACTGTSTSGCRRRSCGCAARADELAHYAKAATDVEYEFPFGWQELEGIANRTDYDLSAHQYASGEDLTYFDQEQESRYLPYVIEPAWASTAMLVFLLDAYRVEVPTAKGDTDKRTVLGLHRDLAPIKVAVLPLSRNEKLVPEARLVHDLVKPEWITQYDDAGAIGRRYRRQDEVGTPFCVTVDFDSLDDRQVTVRARHDGAGSRRDRQPGGVPAGAAVSDEAPTPPGRVARWYCTRRYLAMLAAGLARRRGEGSCRRAACCGPRSRCPRVRWCSPCWRDRPEAAVRRGRLTAIVAVLATAAGMLGRRHQQIEFGSPPPVGVGGRRPTRAPLAPASPSTRCTGEERALRACRRSAWD